MTQREIREYNMAYLRLNDRQYHIFASMMKTRMSLYPRALLRLLQLRGRRYGMCGEVIAESVADWVRKKIA